MGVFSRKKITEDVPVEEERQEEAKTASSGEKCIGGKSASRKTAAEYPDLYFLLLF